MVGASRSATGHPILLGGPQAGYFVAADPHGRTSCTAPTIHARGATLPRLSLLVVMGRTQDYAWTPTAGGSDMIDTYVEELCEPDGTRAASEESRYYEFDGKCVEMDRRTSGPRPRRRSSSATCCPTSSSSAPSTGPVLARGKIGDKPVAGRRKRSTYGKELDPAVSILKLNRNEAQDGQDFVSIFEESHNLSTNWSYADDHEIAYVHGGLYPRRPGRGRIRTCPVWGTGQWEWAKGADGQDEYLGREEVPHEVGAQARLLRLVEQPPGAALGASDAQWGWSSIYRAKMLEDSIRAQAPGTITPTRLVQMMEKAGLTDMRGELRPARWRCGSSRPAPEPGPREQQDDRAAARVGRPRDAAPRRRQGRHLRPRRRRRRSWTPGGRR